MLKKFMDGLVFGAGFGIAFIALWIVAAMIILPAYFESEISSTIDSDTLNPVVAENERPSPDPFGIDVSFHTLSIEEQITGASAIALAKYEPADDGRMKAIIKEFLKLKPGTEISYEVGDEHSGSSYYPGGQGGRGDGIIIFFTGSPAVMQMSASFDGDRITGLSDIPLELFREKCMEHIDGSSQAKRKRRSQSGVLRRLITQPRSKVDAVFQQYLLTRKSALTSENGQ